ncbi:cation transporter [bacterium]|nr:cation transporter [bacterium]
MSHHHHNYHDSTHQIKAAFFLNLSFTLLEIVGGILTNSVAILSDAIHDLGDSLSLGVAWLLERISKKRHDAIFSYGYRRFSLLGALINVLVLLGGSVLILTRAIPRLLNPEATYAPGMIALAIMGILANGFAAFRLKGGRSANARVVMLHLMEDVIGWAAVLLVSIILLFTKWYILDSILSILITLWVLANVVRHLRHTLRLFLQGVPPDISVDHIRREIEIIEGVWEVHHLHVWSLDGEHHVLTAHIVIDKICTREELFNIKGNINQLAESMHFAHTTLEFELSNEHCLNTADCL